MMQFLKQVPSIRFMQRRRHWYWLSAADDRRLDRAVMVRGLNLTVDFTGGVVLEVGFSQPIDLERGACGAGHGRLRGLPGAQLTAPRASSKCGCRRPGPGRRRGIATRVMDAMQGLDAAAEAATARSRWARRSAGSWASRRRSRC